MIMKIAIVKLDREITNANVCKRCGENVKMKQPLITIEGKDCSKCTGGTPSEDRPWFRENCPHCQGKGKSPAKLIFDARGLECNDCSGYSIYKSVRIPNPLCIICKGNGYLLPKKGEYMVTCKKFHFIIPLPIILGIACFVLATMHFCP